MLAVLQQLVFGWVLICGVAFTSFVATLLDYVPGLGSSLKRGLVVSSASWCFGATIFWSFWIRVKLSGRCAANFKKCETELAKPGECVTLLTTHASYLDALLLYRHVPATLTWRSRTIASGALRKLPLLGKLCQGCGHIFLGYAKGNDPAKFTLEAESKERVRREVAEHMTREDGGVLFFAPEGTVNATPDTLLPFRTGGMRLALDTDAQLWSIVFVNNHHSWPKAAAIGGFPAKIAMDFQPIFNDPEHYRARSVLARARDEIQRGKRPDVKSTHDEDHDAALLGAICRGEMQKNYDALIKDLDVLYK